MSGFLTEGLPFPVIAQEPAFGPVRDLRLDDYISYLRARGFAVDTQRIASTPAVAAAESAAAGDLYYLKVLNYTARVALLSQFAEAEDLDLHASRIGLVRGSDEGDPALRERIRLALKGKSAAGPDDYYISAVRNAEPDRVVDVAVRAETRNASERVLILSVLTRDNGGVIDQELTDRLTEIVNDPTFRSRNVTVEIVPAVIKVVAVNAMVYLYPNGIQPTNGAQLLRDAFAQDQRLGFDLTDSYVKKQLHQPGVQRVELIGWNDALADTNEAIALGVVNVQYERLLS